MKLNKTRQKTSRILLALIGALVISSVTAEAAAGQINIDCDAPQQGDQGATKYYGVDLTDGGSVTVTVTASGSVDALDDAKKCTCPYNTNKEAPAPKPPLEYTFDPKDGNQATNNGPTVTKAISATGIFNFKATKIKENYENCSSPWVGTNIFQENKTESKNLQVIAYKIETLTQATVPADRKRKKIGVGEKVDLTFSPSSVTPTWSVTGAGGSVSGGANATYTAPATGGKATVKASFNGLSKSIEFEIVEPKTVSMVTQTNAIILKMPDVLFPNSPLKIDIRYADIYIGPEDVNFKDVAVNEGTCPAVITGTYFLGAPSHPAGGPVLITETLVPGKGWKVNCGTAGDNIMCQTRGPVYTPSVWTWNIPWFYTVSGSQPKQFTTVPQVMSLTAPQPPLLPGKATLTVQKVGVNESVSER